jgi:hypothetical protein
MELMCNYYTAICCTLLEEPTLQTFHQIDILKIDFLHTHVLHVNLGLSVVHLASFRLMTTLNLGPVFCIKEILHCCSYVTEAMIWRSGIRGASASQSS